ncbi:MAG: serine/threonine protein kinase, partial [Xenococcus sp. (in: cyanobacteria)]
MWEAGQVIHDRYQLRERFGNNTGRQTWLAQDLAAEASELVIVKLLTFGGNIQWDDVKLFEREGQILQQLNYDRIPKYKNYFSIDDITLWFGLVEEYISGNSLKQLLAKGTRFGEAEVIKIAQEVLQIL